MEITTKTEPDKIMEYFRNCGVKDSVNLSLGNGNFVTLVGSFNDGILTKLDNGVHYYAHNGKWVKLSL